MAVAYIGLGANLGDREGNVRAALRAMEARGLRVAAVSPLYETEPWGVLDQPRFINAACAVETNLDPCALLDALKAIEQELGRETTMRYGPRPIDLDILLYDDLIVNTLRLTIPHPGLIGRATALVPLADIAPALRHPLSGRTIAEHLADLGAVEGLAPYPPGLPVIGSTQ